MKSLLVIIIAALMLMAPSAGAAPISISIAPAAQNPASPQMGDHLSFHTIIRNDSMAPVDGLIAWLSLVQVDRGHEQPIDLEDWSAHKAETAAKLAPGQALETDWPMRLIQAGRYRVSVAAASRSGVEPTTSPFADFTVRQKPVVESQRVLPIAFGLPFLLIGALLWQIRKGRGRI